MGLCPGHTGKTQLLVIFPSDARPCKLLPVPGSPKHGASFSLPHVAAPYMHAEGLCASQSQNQHRTKELAVTLELGVSENQLAIYR